MIVLPIFSGCTEQSTNGSGMDVTFTTLNGQTKHLHEYYGKIIVLDLMGANCQPCMYQMFELKKLSENYTRDQLTIISIDVWVSLGENAILLQQYLNAFKQQVNVSLDWTFGLDDTQGTITHQYASEGVPTLYILDTKGNVYYSHVGYEAYATLASTIDELLEPA